MAAEPGELPQQQKLLEYLTVDRDAISARLRLDRSWSDNQATTNIDDKTAQRKRFGTGISQQRSYNEDIRRPEPAVTTSTTTTTYPSSSTTFLRIPSSASPNISDATRLQSRSNLALADTLMKCDLVGPTFAAGLPMSDDESTDDDLEAEVGATQASELDDEKKRENEESVVVVEAGTATSRTEILSPRKVKYSRLIGISCTLAAGLSTTAGSVSIQALLNFGATSHQLNTLRQAGIFLPMLLFILWRRSENPLKWTFVRQWYFTLFLRAMVGIVGPFLYFIALKNLPLGDTTALAYSTPVFIGIFARIFLNERYRLIYLPVTVVIAVGCVLIARPTVLFGSPATTTTNITASSSADNSDTSSTTDRLLGSLCALGVAVTAAVAIIIVRKMRNVSPSVLLFDASLLGLVLCIAIQALDMTSSAPFLPSILWTSWTALLYTFLYMFTQVFAQVLFAISLQYEDANIISLVRTTDIIWAFVAQVVIFNAVPNTLSINGAVLIVVSVLILGLWKVMLMQEKQAVANKKPKIKTSKRLRQYLNHSLKRNVALRDVEK